jgi:MFS transporter, SP family, galactose:H+ symporter
MRFVAVGLVSGTAGVLFGYSVAVVAGALVFLTDLFALDTLGSEVVVTSVLVGAFIGAMTSGELAARWGERRVMMITCVIFVLAPIGLAMAGSATEVSLWRGVLGPAVGTVSMVAPMYVAEASPAARRGALVSLFQFGVTLGILIAYLINFAFTDSGEWRWMFALGCLPGFILFGALWTLPESPRWLLLKGRNAEARSAMIRLHADPEEIEAAENIPVEQNGRWGELFMAPVGLVLVMAGGLFLFQNLSGIDGILYYAPQIFLSVGVSAQTGAILATIGLGAVNMLATVGAMFVVDRLGRRPLLIGGLALMTASLAVLGALLLNPSVSQGEELVTLVCLALFVLAFAFSMGPLPYVLTSEVFPLRIRARGMSLATATSWLLNIVVAMTFLSLLKFAGTGATFLVYAGVCLTGLIFSWFMVPETRGRSLAQIEANLRAGRPVRRLGDI